jgi:hypothetical protein
MLFYPNPETSRAFYAWIGSALRLLFTPAALLTTLAIDCLVWVAWLFWDLFFDVEDGLWVFDLF